MRAADVRPADMRPADMRTPNMRPADMRRPEPTAAACPEANSAAVPAKPATVSTKAVAAAVPAATAAAGVGFECEKRHDEEQHTILTALQDWTRRSAAVSWALAYLHEQRASNTDTGVFPSVAPPDA